MCPGAVLGQKSIQKGTGPGVPASGGDLLPALPKIAFFPAAACLRDPRAPCGSDGSFIQSAFLSICICVRCCGYKVEFVLEDPQPAVGERPVTNYRRERTSVMKWEI